MATSVFKLFVRATWRYKWLLIASEIAATFFVLADSVLLPLVVALIIQKLSEVQSQGLVFDDFMPEVRYLIGTVILKFVSGRVMMVTYNHLEPKVVRDLEHRAFAKLVEHSTAFYADNFTGSLVAKVNRLTTAYKRFIETVLGDISMMLRSYIFYVIALLIVAPIIAVIMLSWSIVFMIVITYLHRRKMKYSLRVAADDSVVTATLADALANMLTIRLFAREPEEMQRFSDVSAERMRSSMKNYAVQDYVRVFKTIAMHLLDVIVLIVMINLVIDGKATIGTAVLVQLYISRLSNNIWNFGRYIDRLEEAFANASEMQEILEAPIDVTDPDKPEKPRITHGELTFNAVSFGYSDTDKTIFNNLTFTVKAGQKVGLVGPSGSGKSTLTKLILRLMDINDGSITIDGQNIANLTQSDLRSIIAYVPQEPLLFHRTIYENISYGNPRATQAEVHKAAEQARALEFIDELPKKMDTVVGERGVKLSGGQRQRIAIARAMLKQAPLLILDEATSSLDSESEKYITAALNTLMKNRTTIVIAHRLSTIQKMNTIIVLDKGKIKETGPHEALLKQDGLYAKLWGHQYGGFIGE